MTTFRFSTEVADGTPSISFNVATDVLEFSVPGAIEGNGGSAAQLQFSTSGSDLLVSLGGAALTLLGVSYSSLGSGNLTFDDGSLFLPGSAGDDTLGGGSGSDYLDGGVGADLLAGGLGNDTYIVNDGGETVAENLSEGTDTVQASISYTLAANVENVTLTGTSAIDATGNTLANVLIGNTAANILSGDAGADTLNGGAGADAMSGGTGNDSYVVDDAGDTVTEALSEGTDTVQSSVTFTLGDNVENLTLTGSSAINGAGNALNNVLTGNSGNNELDGDAGSDTLAGGVGNDTYFVDSAGDAVFENSGEGTDTVGSGVTFVLGNNLENLVLTGSGNINGTGNNGANTLTGNSGANQLNGGTGADAMAGAGGNDTYTVDNAGDTVTEGASAGIDLVQSGVSFTLGTDVENLTLSGSSLINATGNDTANVLAGNSGDNVLSGEDGADTLSGAGGTDTLIGGLGDDTYTVDSTTDVLTESFGEGVDTVQSSVSYTLGVELDNLTLTGASAINGTGNELANTLLGNSGANTLAGGLDADTLNGGAGNDTMLGGDGDDTYVVDVSGDKVTELAGEGTDTVQSGVTYTLGAELENLTLTGTSAINGVGNELANTLTGNTGNNLLNGGLGIDTIVGGTGNDTYVVDDPADVVTEVGAGTDLVQSSASYTLGASVESLTLTGTSAINATGNAQANTLSGNSGANLINGAGGADTMAGAAGNDTYVVDNAGDVVTEAVGGGTDLVQSSASFTLTDNVDNLTLTGTAAIDGAGNTGANQLTGNSGNNTLSGGDGADTLNGGAGADSLVGGVGNDTFVVDQAGDVVVEATGEGIDTVQSGISYTLGTDVENLILTGGTAIDGTGNTAANVLTGNTAANALAGDAGADTLDGGAGADALSGGADSDTYIVDNAGDVVAEAVDEGAADSVQSSVTHTLAANVENLTLTGTGAISGTGNDLANSLNGNSGNNLLDGLAGVDTMTGGGGNDTYGVDNSSDVIIEAAGADTDTVQAGVSYTLGTNLENLTLTGTDAINGLGNAVANVITGNSGNNNLNGGGGADALAGGAGDDTYVVDNVGDVVTEALNAGVDLVQASVTFSLANNVDNLTLTGSGTINGSGNSIANVLVGNGVNNQLSGFGGGDRLDGGLGTDTLVGGLGNDTYVVDSTADTLTENALEGIDTVLSSVTLTLASEIENLTLTGATAINGTGNDLDNALVGNTAANRLDGGTGDDNLTGGAGDDTYVVDSAADVVTESGGGIDLVLSGVSYTLGNQLENLTLSGTAPIDGTGNGVGNRLVGNSGDNVLDGAGGADTMVGGTGSDTYIVNVATDVVTEALNAGTDSVESSVTYTLAANVENLTLATGAGAISGTGNILANVLTGNEVANTLTGAAGADTMIGGDGNDTYVVDNSADVITEAADEGADLVRSTASYTLSANVENLTLVGTGVISGTGNDLANTLVGNAATNVLDGGTGVDTMSGAAGNDTYVVDNADDVIIEVSTGGVDLVQASASYTLGSSLENLTLIGSGDINGTGNGQGNTLTGNAGANILNGGIGADTMVGGAGDDTYVVDVAGDKVTDSAGVDTIQSGVSYTASLNIENLVLTGAGNTSGTGNAGANSLTGNDGNNLLNGLAGSDTMAGGLGNDTYVVDVAGDVVTEVAGQGTDTVQSAVSYTLAATLENLTLTGSALVNATGNATGNVLAGNTGANLLDGMGGADSMDGGAGNDTYVVDDAGDIVTETSTGTDLVRSDVSFTLGANIENLTLTGNALINAVGNTLNNNLAGNSANNLLNGSSGADTMAGGLGDDTYVVDSSADLVTEGSDAGIDTVQSDLAYTLGANLENLTLTGVGNINGTGNTLANTLTGNNGNNLLNGGTGIAADTMAGGLGNDSYVVDNASDVVSEAAGEGVDLVQSSVTYTLTADVDNLTLTGSTVINGTGNGLANALTGNGVANVLDGGAGVDTMAGGVGNDTYIVDDEGDTVQEAVSAGTDRVESSVSFTLSDNVDHLTLTGSAVSGTGNALANNLAGNVAANLLDGGAGVDTMTGGSGNDTYVVDVTGDVVSEAGGAGVDTVLSAATYTLATDVDNLSLTGTSAINGTGNGLANALVGNSGANLLNGLVGSDAMSGGDGNDTYVVDNAGDTVSELANEGTDTVQSGVNFTLSATLENLTLTGANAITGNGNLGDNVLIGNTGNNTLTGLGGNDILNGGLGTDNLLGGTGDDTYVLDTSGDSIVEAAGAGTDTVQSAATFTLGANLENLTLTGTGAVNAFGNAATNVLTGNSGGNQLNGGAGVDTMTGGLGNDTYVVDNAGDVVTEAGSAGTDAVQVGFSYTLGDNLENLVLTGTTAIDGTGNALNNSLTGTTGNNLLDGVTGNDAMIGLAGNDTYMVDSSTDVVTEAAGAGTDVVFASASFTMGANVETLNLVTGAGDINGTGNTTANTLAGNDGANTLTGGGGKDALSGNSGADTFRYVATTDSGVGATLRDVIADFSSGEGDLIDLSAIDAIPATAGDQDFSFIGSNAFSATDASGQLRFEAGILYGSTDADATAEFEIELTGVSSMAAGDFIGAI